MNRLRLAGFCLASFLAATVFAKDTGPYAPAEAAAHVGAYATVSGKVTGLYTTEQGNVFIRFGGTYPHEVFTAVVFAADCPKFGDLAALDGNVVSVTGTIRLYQDKPEIIPATARSAQGSIPGSGPWLSRAERGERRSPPPRTSCCC